MCVKYIQHRKRTGSATVGNIYIHLISNSRIFFSQCLTYTRECRKKEKKKKSNCDHSYAISNVRIISHVRPEELLCYPETIFHFVLIGWPNILRWVSNTMQKA